MQSIGQVAKRTGLKVPTIRFYEQEGLLPRPLRTESGRRLYSDDDVRRLAFIRHARRLGFELEQIKALLDLAAHPDQPCADADAIARSNFEAVRARIESLRALESELRKMIGACQGGAARDCRIIEALAATDQPRPQEPRRITHKDRRPQRAGISKISILFGRVR